MSTTTFSYPTISHNQRTSAMGRFMILLITGLVLIAAAILVIVIAPNHAVNQAEMIPVAQTSPALPPVAVPVPTPPVIEVQRSASVTPAWSASEIGQSVLAVPVPTP